MKVLNYFGKTNENLGWARIPKDKEARLMAISKEMEDSLYDILVWLIILFVGFEAKFALAVICQSTYCSGKKFFTMKYIL